jgi:magnesium and cobalt transporter
MAGDNDSPQPPRRPLLARLSALVFGEPTTAEDVLELLRDAQSRNLIDRDGLDMIEGVMQVAELRVRDIMVPRAQMDVIDRNLRPEEYLPRVIESGHSRFPLVDGDKDRVIGILLAKDLLRYFLLDRKKRAHFELNDLVRPAVVIPESKRLNVLLREFRATRHHMAIVADEYGGVAGLVTIEDVLEQIVGEIRDETDFDSEDRMLFERGHGEYIVKALMPIDDFNEHLGTRLAHAQVETVGGLVAARFGHVPRRGEAIEIDNIQFEVLRADSRRVHLLRARLAGTTTE